MYYSPGMCCSSLCVLCCRDYSIGDVLTTANALQRSPLQTLSVACGRVRVPKAYANVTLSVAGICDDNSTSADSTECQQAAQVADQNGEVPTLPCAKMSCKSNKQFIISQGACLSSTGHARQPIVVTTYHVLHLVDERPLGMIWRIFNNHS